MTTDDSSDRFFNRRIIAGALLAGSPIGIQVLAPLVWPTIDRPLGLVLVGLCVLAFSSGVLLLWLGHRRRAIETSRRWRVVGMGQGWIEACVRSNSGDRLVVSWNAGAGADKINVWATFSKRSRPRRSEFIEMIFDVDGTAFEWNVSDSGETDFTIAGETWRDVQEIKSMIAVMREGMVLSVTVPALSLHARFTLDGAFDVLREAATLGEESS